MAFNSPIWEGVYQSFDDVPVQGLGFDSETWIGNSLKKINKLSEDAATNVPLAPVSNYRESLLPLLSSLVYSECRKVRILDFGGGLGFTYFQTIYGLPEHAGIEYHIVERESTCQTGRQFFGNTHDSLIFYSELPALEKSFDIVYSSSALQYIEDWKLLLSRLCVLSCQYLLLVDVPAGKIPTFVSAQNYYESKIPIRFFNIDEFLSQVSSYGYHLIFNSVYQPTTLGIEQQYLPMQNFKPEYQLKQACNLLFKKTDDPG